MFNKLLHSFIYSCLISTSLTTFTSLQACEDHTIKQEGHPLKRKGEILIDEPNDKKRLRLESNTTPCEEPFFYFYQMRPYVTLSLSCL